MMTRLSTFSRVMRHLSKGGASLRRAFPHHALDAIEQAVRDAEMQSGGQIRFSVEAALDLGPLLAGKAARERAIEVFSELGVWDTERNNGVLIYVLLAERDVEIVADRGLNTKVEQNVWEKICQEMETAFREGEFEAGALAGIRSVGRLLVEHYPRAGNWQNELPDRPLIR